ncbi:MAG: cbb3-type cytochrome c oxidase subunit II [Nitrospirae bacterium]|nr:cbb3-type cytochrome c oxidase subunit II [Nitrospirota bacterium]
MAVGEEKGPVAERPVAGQPRERVRQDADPPRGGPPVAERPMFILLVAGVGFFIFSIVAMGLAPWTTLRHVSKPPAGFKNPYLDDKGQLNAAGRGRHVYIREGCWHCHSQFVRPVSGESFRYGPVSQAWESMYDVPHLFGTRRIGPDLSREAGRRPDDWHFAHLYNPRSVVPLSVMPPYAFLFDETSAGPRPREEAKDLVAYLQVLGKPFEEQVKAMVYPQLVSVSGAPPEDPASLHRGKMLFEEHCAGCHGALADGNGQANAFLRPSASNLRARYLKPEYVYTLFYGGIPGSAMPSFRELPERDLWAIAQAVSAFGVDSKDRALAAADPTLTEKGKAIFISQCGVCHGFEGKGDGPAAVALTPRPKDFMRRLFDPAHIDRILQEGRSGSAMAPFPALGPDDRKAIAAFLTTLYGGAL